MEELREGEPPLRPRLRGSDRGLLLREEVPRRPPHLSPEAHLPPQAEEEQRHTLEKEFERKRRALEAKAKQLEDEVVHTREARQAAQRPHVRATESSQLGTATERT